MCVSGFHLRLVGRGSYCEANDRASFRSYSYKPYVKPGNTQLYVNHNSNHPPSVLRSIPEAINKRLFNISSDRQSFDSAAPPYQEALRKSGFNYSLHYNPIPPKPKRQRNRNILWFNPHTMSTSPPMSAINSCKL